MMSLYSDEAKIKTVRQMNVDAAMEQLEAEGLQYGWWSKDYPTLAEMKEKDPIGYSEFGGLVERILLAALQEKVA